MKFNPIYLTCLAALVFFYSCEEGGTRKMTPSGYEYTFYSDKSGDKAAPGEFIYYYLDILDDQDSLIQTTRKNPSQPVTTIPKADAPPQQGNPILDVISLASVGDSIGLFLPKDSIPSLPPEFSDVAHIEYRLVITEIVDEATFQARVDEERVQAKVVADKLQAREPEVASIMSANIEKFNKGQLASELKTVEGDLRYVILEEGTGPKAVKGKVVEAQYYGSTLDGAMFDNSFKRGRGFSLTVGIGSVIQGWDKTFPMLNEGTKAIIFIPSELAYGEMGSPPNIGPNQDLAFYVEVEKVQ